MQIYFLLFPLFAKFGAIEGKKEYQLKYFDHETGTL